MKVKNSASLHRATGATRPILSAISFVFLLFAGCERKASQEHIYKIDPAVAAATAKSIEAGVTTELAEGLTLRLWATDSLVADPVSIYIDDKGKLYYTRTNRQKHSEFDIRGHQDWELGSIKLTTPEERSEFLKEVLSPEKSESNAWLADLNKDGSHDWRDLTVEQEEVYRLEDLSGDGIADFSQMILRDFHTEITDVAGAILTHDDDLFIGVSPDMWRLKDENGDGFYETKTSISHGYGVHVGFGGHGMSGLEVGPDGRLYWQIGDLGFSGKDQEGRQWNYPNTGVIVRANPDGSDFEVFAYGNRNTHEFVFDDFGNLITEDNDGDHPGEMERLVYVVNGADIGWRINWQFGKYRDPGNNKYKVWMEEKMYLPRFEGQAAYFLPPLANYVSGPTGMLYNPGTALGPEWKNTFFVGEFVGNPARSGIHAFKLKPSGASFELGEYRNILRGVLATGIDFGPDGALYMADWIEGWDTKNFGRVWKLDVENNDTPIRRETQALLADDFKKYEESKLGALLKHEDKRVRQRAQFELVDRKDEGLEIFKANIAPDRDQFARIHSIWGISQLERQKMNCAPLLLPLLEDQDAEIRAQAARWLGDVRYRDAGAALLPLLKDENSRTRFFAAEALGRIAYEPAIEPIVAMLRENDDRDVYLRHAGSLALARIGKPAPVVALSKDPSRAIRIAAVITLRRMRDAGIASFLNDKDEFIVTEAARAINDDLNITPALPALGDILLTTKFRNEPLLRRCINANLEVGTDKAMHNLIDFAQREDVPVAMRNEAIAALSTWAKPSVVDRVDGTYRGVIERDPSKVRTLSRDALIKLSAHGNSEVRIESLKAVSKLKLSDVSAVLFERLRTDKVAAVRLGALQAFAALQDKQLSAAVKHGLSDSDITVRVAALDLLTNAGMTDDEMTTLLATVINTRTPAEKQAALTTLAGLPLKSTQPILEQLMKKLEDGKLSPEISIEFSEAIEKSGSKELQARYRNVNIKAGADSLFVQYSGTLSGGNADMGRAIFFGHQAAQCTRCHAFDDMGGNAGPRLNGIGSRLSREQLLEALITPSARIAPGFGTATVALKNGKKISGVVVEESPSGLLIRQGQQKTDTLVSKQDIQKTTMSGSSMPPMNLLLTKREIRDLVSFLSSLKETD